MNTGFNLEEEEFICDFVEFDTIPEFEINKSLKRMSSFMKSIILNFINNYTQFIVKEKYKEYIDKYKKLKFDQNFTYLNNVGSRIIFLQIFLYENLIEFSKLIICLMNLDFFHDSKLIKFPNDELPKVYEIIEFALFETLKKYDELIGQIIENNFSIFSTNSLKLQYISKIIIEPTALLRYSIVNDILNKKYTIQYGQQIGCMLISGIHLEDFIINKLPVFPEKYLTIIH